MKRAYRSRAECRDTGREAGRDGVGDVLDQVAEPGRAHRDQQVTQVDDFGLAGGIEQLRPARRQNRGHQRGGLEVPTFKPVFVPGSTEDNPHATTWNILRVADRDPQDSHSKPAYIQFYLGVDGLNIWLVVLTPPSRTENRGDEGRYLHEAAEQTNLH